MKPAKRFLRFSIYIALAGLIFSHCHFYYHVVYQPASRYIKAAKTKPLDAIIVPGVPVEGGKWGFVMKWRVSWSVYLYKKGITKNIIFSGSAVYTPYVEAKIMALYAEKMGVSKEHLFIETKAEHTTENLYYGYLLAKEKGFTTVGFATDPFQSMQIEPYIEKFNLPVTLIPMVTYIAEQFRINNYEIESYKAYQLNFRSIRDRETEEEQEFYSKGGRIPIN